MKRRQFLQAGSIMSLPVMLGGMPINAISRSSFLDLLNTEDDRVLVIIQLNGGNDGLNMVIPIDQYEGLNAVRSNLVLPENKVLKLIDTTGFHPAMQGLQSIYDEGKLAVVQSVGYPNQNRSHFRSTDIWTTGSAADAYLSTGWVGRYLDDRFPGYPDNYPNPTYPDPLAITLGALVSETCQGSGSNFSFTLTSSDRVRFVNETVHAQNQIGCYGMELDFIKTSIQQSNAYAESVLTAFEKGTNKVEYPETNLGAQLKNVAHLIAGGLKTKIYVASIGGFDTHANQVLIGDSENGAHAELLATLSEAITSFVHDLDALGLSERVVGMTFSEFGRQIRANNSFGTDHGTAAPLMVFGSCVEQGIFGQNPEISPDTAPQEGVPMQYDFRSVYASILIDWFGVEEADVADILFDDFQKIPFLKNCSLPSSSEDISSEISIQVSPNPVADVLNISFVNTGREVHLSVFDALGSQLAILCQDVLLSGRHNYRYDLSTFPSGTYYVRLAIDHKVATIKIVKI